MEFKQNVRMFHELYIRITLQDYSPLTCHSSRYGDTNCHCHPLDTEGIVLKIPRTITIAKLDTKKCFKIRQNIMQMKSHLRNKYEEYFSMQNNSADFCLPVVTEKLGLVLCTNCQQLVTEKQFRKCKKHAVIGKKCAVVYRKEFTQLEY